MPTWLVTCKLLFRDVTIAGFCLCLVGDIGLGFDGHDFSWDGAVCNIVCGSLVVLQTWVLVHLCNCSLVFVYG